MSYRKWRRIFIYSLKKMRGLLLLSDSFRTISHFCEYFCVSDFRQRKKTRSNLQTRRPHFANIVCRTRNSAKTAKLLEKIGPFWRENFVKHCNFVLFSMNDKMYTDNIQNVSFFLHRRINLKKPESWWFYALFVWKQRQDAVFHHGERRKTKRGKGR